MDAKELLEMELKEIEKLKEYKSNWETLWAMLIDLEHFSTDDNGVELDTMDGFVQVWKKQNEEIEDLKKEVDYLKACVKSSGYGGAGYQ